jgi:hypothetical protein
LADPARLSSAIDIRRTRTARHDAVEIALLIALAIGFIALLIWAWPR